MAEMGMFRRVNTQVPLVDRVVDEIQRAIVTDQLEPGMKLPSERELTEGLGVSRTVVREAVRILTARGLLETRPGIGTLVRQVTRDQIVEPLSLLIQTQKGHISIEHLHAVRRIMEVEIARLAALQATEADIAELRQILEEMAEAGDAPDDFAAADAAFHQALANTTHNPLLILLLDSIRDLMQQMRLLVARHPQLYDQVMADHALMLDRVAARDEAGARDAMERHLEHAWRFQAEILAERAGSEPLVGEEPPPCGDLWHARPMDREPSKGTPIDGRSAA